MSDIQAAVDGGAEIAAPDQLRQIIEEIEALEEQKQGKVDDIKDAYAAAKGQGYDTKPLKRIIALRKIDKASRDEADAILTSYMEALGMA